MQNRCSKSSSIGPARRPGRQGRLRRDQRRLLRMAVLVSLALSMLWTPRLLAATASPAEPDVYVVRAGDSLWDLAGQRLDSGDPRRFVDEVRRLNRLDSAELHPGQRLRLPARD